MKHLASYLFIFTLLFGGLMSVPSKSAFHSIAPVASAHLHKPLMIIRFNQRRVYYQKPLYNALSRAIKAAPAVRFALVSYVPATGNPDKNQYWLGAANQHMQEVVSEMRKMGVPPGQISMNSEMDPALKFDELHIFVH